RMPSGDLPTSVTVDAGQLAAAVKRAATAVDHYESVRLIATDGAVTVQGIHDGQVAASEIVRGALDGPPVSRHYCPGYLAGRLAGLTGDMALGFPAPGGKPLRITAGAFTAILMPIRSGDDDDAELIARAAAEVPEPEPERTEVADVTDTEPESAG